MYYLCTMYNWFNSTCIADMIANPPMSEYNPKSINNDWKLYKNRVWKLTESIAHLIPDIETRAFKGNHIDHIVSIDYGFKNNICPYVIASIDNLRMLHHKDNCLKGIRVTDDSKQLLSDWELLKS